MEKVSGRRCHVSGLGFRCQVSGIRSQGRNLKPATCDPGPATVPHVTDKSLPWL